MKKALLIALVAISTFVTTACSNEQAKESNVNKAENIDSEKSLENNNPVESKDEDIISAQSAIEKHFQYIQEKDQEKFLTTMTERQAQNNSYLKPEDIKNIKLLKITEDKSESSIQGYLESIKDTESETTKENVKIFYVSFEIEYVDESAQHQNNGELMWVCYLIRKDENSPWLIDGFAK